jgi:hypothetical protein
VYHLTPSHTLSTQMTSVHHHSTHLKLCAQLGRSDGVRDIHTRQPLPAARAMWRPRDAAWPPTEARCCCRVGADRPQSGAACILISTRYQESFLGKAATLDARDRAWAASHTYGGPDWGGASERVRGGAAR